jgi:broad-specificity NMP kinase
VTLLEVQPVVLITGIPASGKSTVADLLARRFDRGVHVRGDIYRRMVVTGRQEMTAAPSDEAWRQLRLRYHLGAAAADAYHEAGFSVVVQDVVIGPVLGDYVAAIGSTPLIVIVLTPRPDVVAQREEERGKAAYRDGVHTLHQLHRALLSDTPRVGMWLDSTDQRAEETVDEIVERGFYAGRVR